MFPLLEGGNSVCTHGGVREEPSRHSFTRGGGLTHRCPLHTRTTRRLWEVGKRKTRFGYFFFLPLDTRKAKVKK